MTLHHEFLFKTLRGMKKAGDDFYFDGDSTAIRLVILTPALEERLGRAFHELLVKYRHNAMQTGLLLVWEGLVSPSYSEDCSHYYAVVTIEGWCPRTKEDFDQEILGSV